MEFHINFVKMKMLAMYYSKEKTNFIKLMKSTKSRKLIFANTLRFKVIYIILIGNSGITLKILHKISE